ncbi:MAG: Z1 domain-containing protein [Actinomycetales bacterium]
MNSDGDRLAALSAQRRVVMVKMDALRLDLEAALADVPENLRADLRAQMEDEQRAVNMNYRNGAEIVDGGPRPWLDSWDPNAGYYWRRLREYLVDRKAWSLREVDDLNSSSNRVLRHIEDPRMDAPHSQTDFRVQGLVLGYVQSGKTANFTSLIAKAADRGYRLIIVLSGVHNSLRAQTQRRLDLELGLVPDPKGVGRPDSEHRWWAITSADLKGDFDPRTDAGPLAQGGRGIMVVKKNATVLRRLVGWLDGEVPPDLAVLIIDDEADQASINTQPSMEEADLGDDTGDVTPDQELDPSTINGLIRQLISRFRRTSYVAYTATPFANVLINPDAESDRWGNDLFPKDFIISLPRPATYVGAERVFGRPALEHEDQGVTGLDVVRIVPDSEISDLVPRGKAALASWEPTVTETLRAAMLDWVLATAGKIHRLGDGISTMLVHTTQRIAQQNELAAAISGEMKLIRQRWRFDRESLRPELLERWNRDFRPVTVSMDASLDARFGEIEPHIDDLLERADGLRMLVLNSESPDLLDYEADPRLKVLLIGGNRLSRGLTLEDLTVSFYVREAATYDTLLQMGRWFGYRGKFIDLTRLWTTGELVARFRHLSLVEEDLRDQIKIYERENLTPVQIAPKIRAHPDMLVVAKNRMGSAESVRQSYSGELIQMTRFKLDDDEWLEHNLTITRELVSALGRPNGVPNGRVERPAWSDVPWGYIEGFLQRFRTAQDAMSFDADTAARYIRRQAERHGELTSWSVAVQCGIQLDSTLGRCNLGLSRGPVPAIGRSRLKADPRSIGALVSPARENNLAAADESADLTSIEIARAAKLSDTFPTRGHALRWQRPSTRGLLLIYPISPSSRPGPNAKNREPLFDDSVGRPHVIGIALSFPPSYTGATVEYVAGMPSSHAVKLAEDIG